MTEFVTRTIAPVHIGQELFLCVALKGNQQPAQDVFRAGCSRHTNPVGQHHSTGTKNNSGCGLTNRGSSLDSLKYAGKCPSKGRTGLTHVLPSSFVVSLNSLEALAFPRHSLSSGVIFSDSHTTPRSYLTVRRSTDRDRHRDPYRPHGYRRPPVHVPRCAF